MCAGLLCLHAGGWLESGSVTCCPRDLWEEFVRAEVFDASPTAVLAIGIVCFPFLCSTRIGLVLPLSSPIARLSGQSQGPVVPDRPARPFMTLAHPLRHIMLLDSSEAQRPIDEKMIDDKPRAWVLGPPPSLLLRRFSSLTGGPGV